jgi:hypothetical protein
MHMGIPYEVRCPVDRPLEWTQIKTCRDTVQSIRTKFVGHMISACGCTVVKPIRQHAHFLSESCFTRTHTARKNAGDWVFWFY